MDWFTSLDTTVQVALVGVVSAAVTAGCAAIVAVLRPGGGSGQKQAELAVATLDSSAIKELSGSVSDLNETVKELVTEVRTSKVSLSRMADQVDQSLKQHGTEVSRHREEMIRSSSQ